MMSILALFYLIRENKITLFWLIFELNYLLKMNLMKDELIKVSKYNIPWQIHLKSKSWIDSLPFVKGMEQVSKLGKDLK